MNRTSPPWGELMLVVVRTAETLVRHGPSTQYRSYGRKSK